MVYFKRKIIILMKLKELKDKAEEYYLIKYAGKYYVDETSEIIKELNREGKNVILGIRNKKKNYTIIGMQFVYYLTSSGVRGKILLKEFTDQLHENASRIGAGYLKRKFLFKNIVLSNGDKVWLHNSKTMFALWSTILWLAKEERRRVFRENEN